MQYDNDENEDDDEGLRCDMSRDVVERSFVFGAWLNFRI